MACVKKARQSSLPDYLLKYMVIYRLNDQIWKTSMHEVMHAETIINLDICKKTKRNIMNAQTCL